KGRLWTITDARGNPVTDLQGNPLPLTGSVAIGSLTPGTYLVGVSGWAAAQAAGVRYQLRVSTTTVDREPTDTPAHPPALGTLFPRELPAGAVVPRDFTAGPAAAPADAADYYEFTILQPGKYALTLWGAGLPAPADRLWTLTAGGQTTDLVP